MSVERKAQEIVGGYAVAPEVWTRVAELALENAGMSTAEFHVEALNERQVIPHTEQCVACAGCGVVHAEFVPSATQWQWRACERCLGSGRVVDPSPTRCTQRRNSVLRERCLRDREHVTREGDKEHVF